MASCPSKTRLEGGLHPLSSPPASPRALPASLTEIVSYLILFSLQGPEPEWESEAFPRMGLVLGAFLALVVSELESEVSLASQELAFPVSPSSIWGNQEKACGLLFPRALGGVGECRLGFNVLREELGESAGRA